MNHNVIDVTRGRHLYGPGGPYDLYAGRDASRGLATFSVDANVVRETYDDLRFVTIVFITDKLQIIYWVKVLCLLMSSMLVFDFSDLSPSEKDALGEWESQLVGKYDVVGRLLAPGESPRDYDDEDDAQDKGHEKAS